MSEEAVVVKKKKSEAVPTKRRANKIVIPRREPSVHVPPRRVVFITADKTTCEECTCFPKEDPYVKPKKLNPCQKTPLTLYELEAKVVDELKLPEALNWSQEEVAEWIANECGFPQYRESILDNHIDGMRLLMLEDPSNLPKINIHIFEDILKISSAIRKLYKTDFVKFARSIGLPPRKPLTHCTLFKSRTGPSWGIRQNWTRYQKPDFPKVLFGRIAKKKGDVFIPHYVPPKREICREYMMPRKFRFQTGIPEEAQMIWMERTPVKTRKKKEKRVVMKVQESRLTPKKVSLEGLKGREFLLAKRKMPNPKFLV